MKELDRLRKIVSYLPKVPTQPYERRLARENQNLLELVREMRDDIYKWEDTFGADNGSRMLIEKVNKVLDKKE